MHADDYILRRIIAKQCEWLLRAWEKAMAGERLAIVALRWKALYASVEARTPYHALYQTRVEPTFSHASCLLTFLQRLDCPTSPPGTGLHEDEPMRLV